MSASVGSRMAQTKIDVYGFHDYDKECNKYLTKLDIDKLDNAMISNIQAERITESVNFELEPKIPYCEREYL